MIGLMLVRPLLARYYYEDIHVTTTLRIIDFVLQVLLSAFHTFVHIKLISIVYILP